MDYNQYSTNGAERKPQKHLTLDDRGAIEAMTKKGFSNREIARYLHCSATTVANELKRGTKPRTGSRGRASGYSAKRGNDTYLAHRKNSHKPHRVHRCSAFLSWVTQQVRKAKWSLDACVGYARKHQLFSADEMVSTKTLYNEVNAGTLALKPLDLPEVTKRKKHQGKPAKRGKSYGRSIDERPKIVERREEIGHWEGDTVVGKRAGKEAVTLTLLEKKLQEYITIRIPGKTSEAVLAAMEQLREAFGEKFSEVFKTITVDNGSEFADFAKVEQFGTKVYFAHPYTSCERAQNERHNGMFRRYAPKGASMELFSDDDVAWFGDELNRLPRKKLGYCTPEELFEAFLGHYRIIIQYS